MKGESDLFGHGSSVCFSAIQQETHNDFFNDRAIEASLFERFRGVRDDRFVRVVGYFEEFAGRRIASGAKGLLDFGVRGGLRRS